MNGLDKDLRAVAARERAALARARFTDDVQSVQRRFAPARLKDDARDGVKQKLVEARQDAQQAIRRHPVLTAAGLASLLSIMFWKPARVAALYGMRGAQLVWLNRSLWRKNDDE